MSTIARPRERGMAVVAALLFAVTILAFTSSVLVSGYALQQQKRYSTAVQMAQDAAESGIQMVVARISSPAGALLRAAGGMQGVLRGTTARAQRYELTLDPAGDDGADNDLDGKVDEEDEADMLECTCTGYSDNVARTVRVTLLARYQKPAINSATYIADPNADMKLDGNSFLISGYDITPTGVKTGEVVAGIGVAGDPAWIKTQISRQLNNNVIGMGPSPSVYKVSALDMRELIDAGARSANITLESGSAVKPSAPGEWGTLDTPAIVYGTGGIHISSGAEGAGILVVDGDLTISGSFAWKGLIIVRGNVIFSGGGGTKRLVGALIIEKDIRADDSKRRDYEMTINGTIDVLFSRQTIAKVMTVFATYTIVNWREGPNPKGDALP